jgi:hypothetical protein
LEGFRVYSRVLGVIKVRVLGFILGFDVRVLRV